MIFWKKWWVWLCRYRKRKGYGVHSPSAYFFIRSVIYEKDAYYAYRPLREKRKRLIGRTEKLDKLLFRLANFVQPETIVLVGEDTPLSLEYLSRGCRRSVSRMVPPKNDPTLTLKSAVEEKSLGMLVVPAISGSQAWAEAALPLCTEKSLIVMEGIHQSREMKNWWESFKQNEQVCRTYDLYSVGLVFFDHSKIKEHYTVNFV